MKKTLTSLACGLLAGMACCSATAQSSVSTPEWQFEFSPYAWAPGVKGHVSLADGLILRSTSIDSTSLIKALKYAVMGTFEARNGPWGVLLDINLVQVGQSRQSNYGLLGGYDFKLTQGVYTVAGSYRVVDSPAVTLDLVGGARYVGAKAQIYAAPSIFGLGRYEAADGGFWNGIVGANLKVPVSDKWSLIGYVDAGSGAGATSRQAIAGANYQYSPTTAIKLGYRYLSFKRDNKALNDVSLGGFYLGAGFRF